MFRCPDPVDAADACLRKARAARTLAVKSLNSVMLEPDTFAESFTSPNANIHSNATPIAFKFMLLPPCPRMAVRFLAGSCMLDLSRLKEQSGRSPAASPEQRCVASHG